MTYGIKAGSILAGLLIGLLHAYILAWAWAYISVFSPLPSWLNSQGSTGVALQAALFPADLVTNFLLCIPAAFLLCKLRPKHLWLYLLLAVMPNFLWQYRLFLVDATLFQNWQIYVSGALLVALPLPLTALLFQHLAKSDAPNNSFKPSPLRGLGSGAKIVALPCPRSGPA